MCSARMTPKENLAAITREHAAGKVVVESLPSILSIESTSICNLRCVMCPHSIGGVHRPQHLPAEVVDSLADVLPAAHQVQLHGIGEPLASPSFWGMLSLETFDKNAELSVNTNLTLLNERKLAMLLGAKPRLTLNVSLDAATADTYSKIRGADFHKVLENVTRIRGGRGAHAYPRIFINMTLMRTNIEEVVEFVELAHRLRVDAVLLGHLNRWPARDMALYRHERNGWCFDYAQEGLWNHAALSDRWIRAALRRSRDLGVTVHLDSAKQVFFDDAPDVPEPTGSTMEEHAAAVLPAPVQSETTAPPPAIETIKDCRYPWQWAMITADGAVRPCCHGGEVGNIHKKGFQAVWNGVAMRSLRRDVLANRVNAVCAEAACKFVQNTVKINPKERARAARLSGLKRLRLTMSRAVRVVARMSEK